KLRNRRRIDRLHSDVVIEMVDVVEICFRGALNGVDADVHPKPLGVLRGCETYVPERQYEQSCEKQRRNSYCRPGWELHRGPAFPGRAPLKRLNCDAARGLVLALSATVEPAGDTLIYPCISWWSAEQKSVQ